MVAQFAVPVIVTGIQLDHQVPTGFQLSGRGIALVIGGKVANEITVFVLDPEGPAAKLIAGVGRFLELNSAEVLVGKCDCRLFACGDGHLLFDVRVIGPVGFIPVMDFHHVILTGQQLFGSCIAVSAGGDGLYQFLIDIENLETPILRAAVDGVLLDPKVTVVVIREGNRCSCIGSNLNGLDGSVDDPVRIIHRNFLCIQGLRHQIVDGNGTIRTSRKGRSAYGLGAGGVRIDPDLPSAQITAGVGLLDDLYGTGFPGVLETHRCGAAIGNRYLLRILTGTAVHRFNGRIRMAQLLNVIRSDFETGYGDLTGRIRRMGSGNQCGTGRIRVDTELPSCHIRTVIRGLCQTEIAGPDLIREAYGSCSTKGDGHLLGIGTGAHILGIDTGIGMADFLDVIRAWSNTGHRDLAIGIGSMGTGHELTAGSVRVNTELPAGQVLIVIRDLRQSQAALIQFVDKGNGCCLTQCDDHLLGIGTGAHILRIDGGVGMTDFLNVIRTGSNAGHRDLTVCICGMGTGHQSAAGCIRINTELPARQVLIVFSSFRKRQVALIELVHECNGSSTASGDRDLLRIGAGTDILGIDRRIGMTEFFYVISTSGQTGNIDLTGGTGRMRTRYQTGTGRIGIDAKTPAG